MSDYVILIIMCLPLIRPEGIGTLIPVLDTLLYNYAVLISALFIVIFSFNKYLTCRLKSRFIVTLAIYIMYGLFVTVLKSGPIYSFIGCWYKSILLILVFDIYSRKIIKPLRVIEVIAEIISTINLLCLFLYPDGMYVIETTGYTNCWFLGYKSSFQYILFPLLIIATLLFEYRNEKKNFIYVLVTVHIQAVLGANIMLVITLIIYDVFFFSKLYQNHRCFSFHSYAVIVVISNILAVFFFTKIMNIQLVRNFIETVLGKMTTIMIRFNIWSIGLSYIKKGIFWGYGYTTGREMLDIFGIGQFHLHNQILMILLHGGIIGFILFLAVMSAILRCQKSNKTLLCVQILNLGIFALFISVIVEVFISSSAPMIWILFYLSTIPLELEMQLSINLTKRKHGGLSR